LDRPVGIRLITVPGRPRRRPGKDFPLGNERCLMRLAKNACLALICSAALSTLGCCYHAKNFGRARDIGICEIGCSTCMQQHDNCCTDGCRTDGSKTSTTEPLPAPLPKVQIRPERLP
jgi:hypothetical protein